MSKRFLSLLLAVIMVVSMLPVTALAADGGDAAYVAKVGDQGYESLQEAIKAAAPNGTVEILDDVTVDKWVMFAENLSIANGNIITLNINGLTINGNNHTLTIDSIESAGNGNRLFYDAQNLNINNLTIKYADGLGGGIGLQSGTISKVTFDGGVYGVLPGTGDVKIEDCTFKTNGTSIYFEGDRDDLVVTGNTFDNANGAYAINLRGDVTFTDNTIITGKVNVVNGSPVVTGNNFGNERFKVYNDATATITGNTINNLEFNNKTAAAKSTFSDNTLSDAAQAALDAVTPNVAKIGETKYETLQAAVDAAKDGDTITLLADVTENITIADDANIVLDLNSKTLNGYIAPCKPASLTVKNGSIKNTNSSYSAIEIDAGDLILTNVNIDSARHAVRIDGDVTATIDGGTIKGAIGTGTGTYHAVNVSGAANVTIKSGTFVGPKGTTADSGSAVNAKTGSTVTIEGGSFSGGKRNTLSADGTLTVKGGTYDQDPTAYVAEGYEAVKTDSAWTVQKAANYVAQIGETKYETLAAAITAAQAGDTIKLLADVTENVTINKNLTIDGDSFKYTGKMDLKNVSVTIENVNFVKGQINKDKNGTSENVTIKNCTFDGQGLNGYAINLNTTNYIVIENCTAENYVFGFLQVPSSNASVSVKNVKISSVAYGAKIDYSNGVTLENVTIENAAVAGILDSNFGAKTITLKNCTIYAANPIAVWERNTTVTDTFKFEGTNDFGTEEFEDEMSQYAKLVLADTGATLEACAGLSVTTTVADYTVVYENGIYKVAEANYVAQIGETKYMTLADAIAAAKNGDTITLLADCGEDVTIKQAEGVKITIDGDDKAYTGTITVDGGSKRYETAALTIKNVNFDATDITKDASINLGASGNNNTRYTDNVTMTNCSFTGTGNAKVGIKQYTAGCKNLTVTGCTATGMHSLIQLKNIDGVTVSDCEITGSKSGISLGASSNVMVSNCKMDVTDYGIRADGSGAYDMTVADCTISAELPIVVRNATGAYELTLGDNNTLTASNTEGYQIIFTNGDDGTYVAPTGAFVLTGADGMKVFPSYVAQIGETKYMTLAAAIDAAQNGETVTVLTDITLTEGVTVPAGKNITLDLNGKTISGECNANKGLITVENTAKLTIEDSSDPSTGKITCAAGSSNVGYTIDVKGDLVLESGTIELTGSWSIGFAVDVRPNAWGTAYTVPTTFVMNGGKIVSSDSAVRVASNSSDSYEELGVSFTMNGGEIESEWDAIFVQHLYVGDLDVKVVDGTVSGENSVLRVYGDAGSDVKMDIQGGTFSGEVKVADAYADADPIVITGGTYDNDPTTWVADGYVAVDNNNGTWTVSDDYVEWIKAELLAGRSVILEKDIVVDGSYIDSIPAATNGNGRYFNPGIFNVVGDVDVTFDLNGHTITYTGHADAEYTATNNASYYNGTVNSCTIAHGLFMANDGANLTIVDSSDNGAGTVNVNGLASGVYACSPNSVITVKGGTWTNDGCAVCGGTNMFLYASHGGEVYITGGTFEQTLDSDGDSYLIVEHGGEYKNSVIDYSKTKIEITGGTFVGMNPEEAVQAIQSADNKLSWDTTNVVAEGYCAIAVAGKDNTWTIGVAVAVNVETGKMYGDVTDALDEAESGQTVQMLQNYEENIVVVPAGVTLDLNGCYLTASNLLSFGDVIDTAETTGGLVIDIDTTKAFTVLQSNNKYLPVYDTNYNENGSVGCYRFYEYKVVSRGISDETSDSVKFKFRMEFTKAEAYKVLAQTTNSGVSYVVTLYWESLPASIPYTVTNGTVKTWASQMYDRVTTNADSLVSMTLTVKGLSKLEGSSITATPSVQTIAGTVASDSEMSYTPTAG